MIKLPEKECSNSKSFLISDVEAKISSLFAQENGKIVKKKQKTFASNNEKQ